MSIDLVPELETTANCVEWKLVVDAYDPVLVTVTSVGLLVVRILQTVDPLAYAREHITQSLATAGMPVSTYVVTPPVCAKCSSRQFADSDGSNVKTLAPVPPR